MKILYSLILTFSLLLFFTLIHLKQMYSPKPWIGSSIAETPTANQNNTASAPLLLEQNSSKPERILPEETQGFNSATNQQRVLADDHSASISIIHKAELPPEKAAFKAEKHEDEKTSKNRRNDVASILSKPEPPEPKRPINSSLNLRVDKQPQAQSGSIPGLYPQGSERILAPGDLDNKSLDDLKIIRNEIFARHSYIFTNTNMKIYFEKQPWYAGVNKNVYPLLSRIETENLAVIRKQERGRDNK